MKKSTILEFLRSKFAGDMIWNGVSFALSALLLMLVNAAIIYKRDSAALGCFNLVYAVYMFVSQLAVGGIHASVLSYVSKHTDTPDRCRTILYSALLVVAALSTGVALLLVAVSPLMTSWYGAMAGFGFLLSIPGVILFSFNKIFQVFFNAYSRMKVLSVIFLLRALGIFIWTLLILQFEISSSWLAAGFSFTEIPVLLFSFYYLERRLLPFQRPSGRLEMIQWAKKHCSFGFRGCMSGVLISMNSHLDVLIMGLFLPMNLVGLYSFAAMYAEGFSQSTQIIRRQLDPYWGRFFAAGDIPSMNELARKVRLYLWPCMTAGGLGLVVLFPVFLHLFKPTMDVAACSIVFGILIAGNVITAPYRSCTGILLQGGRPGTYTTLIVGMLIFGVISNLVLLYYFGMYGTAVAVVLSQLFYALALLMLARRLFLVKL